MGEFSFYACIAVYFVLNHPALRLKQRILFSGLDFIVVNKFIGRVLL